MLVIGNEGVVREFVAHEEADQDRCGESDREADDVDAGVETIAGEVGKRGICATVDLLVFADPELLEHALINLLHNAIDAVAKTSDPCIEINGSWLNERQIGISISDNGCGVAPASLDQIFVPFFSTKPGGSGIGLSLARQIAQAHGGRIDVERRNAGGTVFTLILPLANRAL